MLLFLSTVQISLYTESKVPTCPGACMTCVTPVSAICTVHHLEIKTAHDSVMISMDPTGWPEAGLQFQSESFLLLQTCFDQIHSPKIPVTLDCQALRPESVISCMVCRPKRIRG